MVNFFVLEHSDGDHREQEETEQRRNGPSLGSVAGQSQGVLRSETTSQQ